MKALLDNKPVEFDYGYLMDKANPEAKTLSRVAYHGAAQEHKASGENFKVITSGHVYVLNYNPETYKPSKPLNYKEYEEMRDNNEKMFQPIN